MTAKSIHYHISITAHIEDEEGERYEAKAGADVSRVAPIATDLDHAEVLGIAVGQIGAELGTELVNKGFLRTTSPGERAETSARLEETLRDRRQATLDTLN